jgi:hypothetical protein
MSRSLVITLLLVCCGNIAASEALDQQALVDSEKRLLENNSDINKLEGNRNQDFGTLGLVPECQAPPFPTVAVGPVFFDQTLNFTFAASLDRRVNVKLWRIPCTNEDSLTMITLEPVDLGIQVCVLDFTVIQNGQQFDDTALLQDPSDRFSDLGCQDIFTTQSWVLVAEDNSDNQYDNDAAFQINIDAMPVEAQLLEIPAYDSSLYPGFDGNPAQFDFSLAEDSWLNPNTPGEGLFFDYSRSLDALFVAWFTLKLEATAPTGLVEGIGTPDQRWMTSLLSLDGNIASGQLRARRGGAFDTAPTSFEESVVVGTIEIEFLECDQAIVRYNILSADNLNGEFAIEPLEKNVNPTGYSCEPPF